MELSIDWALWFSLGGLAVAWAVFWYMKSQPAGDENMRELAAAIHSGSIGHTSNHPQIF